MALQYQLLYNTVASLEIFVFTGQPSTIVPCFYALHHQNTVIDCDRSATPVALGDNQGNAECRRRLATAWKAITLVEGGERLCSLVQKLPKQIILYPFPGTFGSNTLL